MNYDVIISYTSMSLIPQFHFFLFIKEKVIKLFFKTVTLILLFSECFIRLKV